MVVGVKNFSTTAATNASADSNINWAENQAPSTVNDSARALMAALAAFYDQIGGALTVGGSSNAYTITNASPGTWAAYATGDLIMMKANHTCTGASTINVDGLGAKSIKTADSGALVSGSLVSGGLYLLAYDGTNFQIVNTIGGSYQPLDATLTAIAALTLDGTNSYIRATGSDTFTADTITTFVASLTSVVTLTGSQALTNKTLTSPTINAAALSGTLSGAATLSGLITFSAGADMTPASTPSTTAVGYLGAPQRSISAADTFVMTDAGKSLYHPAADTTARAWVIPSNASVAFPIGTVIAIVNENAAGVITLSITSDTLRWGSNTGSRTLAANATATLLKVTSTVWRLTGDGIT